MNLLLITYIVGFFAMMPVTVLGLYQSRRNEPMRPEDEGEDGGVIATVMILLLASVLWPLLILGLIVALIIYSAWRFLEVFR